MNGRSGAPKGTGTSATAARCQQKGSVAFFPNKGAAAATAAAVSVSNAIGTPLTNGNYQGVAHVQIKIALHACAQAARAAAAPKIGAAGSGAPLSSKGNDAVGIGTRHSPLLKSGGVDAHLIKQRIA